MRNLLLGLSLSVAFIVGCLARPMLDSEASAQVTTPPPSAPAAQPGKVQFQYECVDSASTRQLETDANRLGKLGYELVGGSYMHATGGGTTVWCFKRRLP